MPPKCLIHKVFILALLFMSFTKFSLFLTHRHEFSLNHPCISHTRHLAIDSLLSFAISEIGCTSDVVVCHANGLIGRFEAKRVAENVVCVLTELD